MSVIYFLKFSDDAVIRCLDICISKSLAVISEDERYCNGLLIVAKLAVLINIEEFNFFNRGPKLNCFYAGMLEYDGDLHLPKHYLVNPPEIKNTLSELLVGAGLSQYAVSETQKYGHVTYFWNGNRSSKFSEELETFKESKTAQL